MYILDGSKVRVITARVFKKQKDFADYNGLVKKFFIFFGGSDEYNLTCLAINALSVPELLFLEINVVISSINKNHDIIAEQIKNRSNSNLFVQTSKISSIMSSSQLAIGSGGVNLLESIALGLHSIVIPYSESHSIQLKDLVKNKMVSYLGKADEINSSTLTSKIKHVINNMKSNPNFYHKPIKYLDGYGLKRIRPWLIGNIPKKKLKLKRASLKDARLYWEWVNDKIVRENSIKRQFIEWDNHYLWFKKNSR